MSLPGFETETQIEDRKRKRQEEWEKVRNPDEPETMPEEEPFDGRSLFDRLKEQRDRKDADFEESKKFKNLVHTLDDDEIDHLKTVDELRSQEERKKREEELKEMNEYRSKVAELQEQSSEPKLSDVLKQKSNSSTTSNKFSSQKSILSGAVKRKSGSVTQRTPSALKVAAILPGIVDYSSDDSDGSDSSEYEEVLGRPRDLMGREIKKVKHSNED